MLKKIVILLAFFMPIVAISIQIIGADEAFSLLTYRHPFNRSAENDELLNTLIQAKEDNLAIISIPLLIPQKPVDGDLSFKIREFESSEWYSISTYSGILAVNDDQLFGFPPITESRSKTYNIVLTLESKNGSHLNIDRSRPIRSKYKFEETTITNNAEDLISFLLKKIFFATQNNPYLLFTAFVYWLPAGIISLFLSKNTYIHLLLRKIGWSHHPSKILLRKGFVSLLITILSTLLDIFMFPQYQNALVTVVLTILWFTLIIKKRVSRLAQVSILMFLIITTQLSFYFLFLDSNLPLKAGGWVFILLTILILNDIKIHSRMNLKEPLT